MWKGASAMATTRRNVSLRSSVQGQEYGRGLHIVRRIIYTCFVLSLLLSLILTAVYVYKRLYHYPVPVTSNTPQPTSTPINVGSPSGSWRVLPSLPSPQADNAAIYVQVQGHDYVYMSGGYHGHTYSPRYDHNLYRYDVAAAQWQVVVNGNFPSMVN